MDDTEELEEANLVRTTEDAVGWLIEMTGCGAQHAKIALSRTSGDISDALDVLPSVQSERLSTEQEVRRLIELADANSSRSTGHNEPSGHKKSNSMKDIIEIPDSDEEIDGDVTEIKIGVINGNNDTVELNDDVIRVDGNPDSAVSRISKKLGVSEDRAKAALRMTGNDEKSAFDMISRQLRKRKRSDEPMITDTKTSEVGPASHLTSKPWELVLLSWNIDGLCERGLSERFSAVISEIKTINPHVVMLQEVVEEHVERIRSTLGKSYDVTLGDRSSSYFNVILVTRKVGSLKILDKNVKKFPTSIMGRHLVQVVCELFGRQFKFYTSHLESMKDHSAERTKQLDKVLDYMLKESRPGISIFGGDMNVRDFEISRIKNIQNFEDVWECTGRDPTTRYTWDTAANTNTGAPYKCKLRFDRIYLRKTTECKPTKLELVGKTKLCSCDMFPSDHWGLLARFAVK